MTVKSCKNKAKVFEKFSTDKLQRHYDQMLLYSTNSYNSYINSGVVKAKRWLTAGKSDVCDTCKKNEQAGAIPIHQKFPSGHLYPPSGLGCRCTLTPEV